MCCRMWNKASGLASAQPISIKISKSIYQLLTKYCATVYYVNYKTMVPPVKMYFAYASRTDFILTMLTHCLTDKTLLIQNNGLLLYINEFFAGELMVCLLWRYGRKLVAL